jgi:delta 1-pyrroline-5-carboxylate dehydrogenase
MKVGDPRATDTVLGPLIRAEQRTSVEGYVERALAEGGEILAGGGRPDEPAGYYMNPALIGGLGNDSEIAQNELFGPVGVLMPYKTLDEAVATANDSRYSLNAAVWGPEDTAMLVAQRLRSGSVAINGGGGPRPDAPWGGPRESGTGREGGDDGFRDFFEVKHIHWPVAGSGATGGLSQTTLLSGARSECAGRGPKTSTFSIVRPSASAVRSRASRAHSALASAISSDSHRLIVSATPPSVSIRYSTPIDRAFVSSTGASATTPRRAAATLPR